MQVLSKSQIPVSSHILTSIELNLSHSVGVQLGNNRKTFARIEEALAFHQWIRDLENKTVHLGLSWVEIESSTVEEDGFLEVLSISKAADSSLDGHEFAVDTFSDGVKFKLDCSPRLER